MKERLQKCKADRVGVTSCHQKEMAGHIEKNRQFENKNRGKQEDSKGLLKMGEKATAALQSEFDAAVEEANTMCTSAKDCCTSVTITIQSKDGGEAVRRFNQNNNASGSRGSHSKKIQCTSKTCQQRGGTEKC